MMNGDEGGQLSDLIGGDTVLMRGDIRLIGGDPPQSPPTRENPAGGVRMLRVPNFVNNYTIGCADSYCWVR